MLFLLLLWMILLWIALLLLIVVGTRISTHLHKLYTKGYVS
jgi:hypothetical protein